MTKVNFGCGSIQPEGWINIDHDTSFGAANVRIYSVADESVDMIVAHCALQEVPYHDMEDTLELLLGKLKNNGVLRISLPDIKEGFKAYQDGRIDWFPNGEEDLDERFSAWLTWYSTSKTLLTEYAMAKKLSDVGFSSVSQVDYKKTDLSTEEIVELDTRNGECYFLEAQK